MEAWHTYMRETAMQLATDAQRILQLWAACTD